MDSTTSNDKQMVGTEVNLKEYIHPKMDILFLALNAPVKSNDCKHWFSGSFSFWTLLFDSGLITSRITKRVGDCVIGDETVFGSVEINFNRSVYGVTDLNREHVGTNSRFTPTDDTQVSRILSILDSNPTQILCIMHSKVADRFDKLELIERRSGEERGGYGVVGVYKQTKIIEVPFHNNSHQKNKHEIYRSVRRELGERI